MGQMAGHCSQHSCANAGQVGGLFTLPWEGRVARIFVSYASEDREYADRLHQWLDGERHEVFLDQDLRDGIALGEEWEQRLHERLRWADAVICVVTSAFLASTWCTYEVASARARGSQLVGGVQPGRTHPGHRQR